MKKILFLIVALSATLNLSANAPAVSVGAAKPVVQASPNYSALLKDLIKEGGAAEQCLSLTKESVPSPLTETLQSAISVAKQFIDGNPDATSKQCQSHYNNVNTAMANSYRQYYYNKLIEVVPQIRAYVSGMETGAIKENLENLLTIAENELAGGFNKNKEYGKYRDAYENLWSAYQNAIRNSAELAISLFNKAINDAVGKKTGIAYEEYAVELYGLEGDGGVVGEAKALLDQYYSGGIYVKRGNYSSTDIIIVTEATTKLNDDVEAIVDADRKKASDDLSITINKATTRKGEIESISTVIANTLGTKITPAEEALENSKNTGKQLFDAAETLSAAIETADDDCDEFLKAEEELETALNKAMLTYAGISNNHEAIRETLLDAVTTAQGVYSNAISKTTADLKSAESDITKADSDAGKAEIQADNIDVQIEYALEALKGITDPTNKKKVEDAIAVAQSAVKTKDTESELKSALSAFNRVVSTFIDADRSNAKTELDKLIASVEDIKTSLAYDASKAELEVAKNKADDVSNKTKPASTAAELRAATEVLKNAINTIVAKDAKQALDALEVAIEKAGKKIDEVNVINTTLAGGLVEEKEKAEKLLEDGIYNTASVRKAEVEKLEDAIAVVDAAVIEYRGQEDIISQAIDDAEKIVILEKHTGIKEALNDAIGEARKVYESRQSKTIQDIKDGIVDLQKAMTEAELAENYAYKLDLLIGSANEALSGMVDSELKNKLDEAIKVADSKSLYGDKKKTSTDYLKAYATLNSVMIECVGADYAKANKALDDAITNAGKSAVDDGLFSTHSTDINSAITKANEERTGATATKLVEIKDELVEVVGGIVKADRMMASDELAEAIANAQETEALYTGIVNGINDKAKQKTYSKNLLEKFTNAIKTAGKKNPENSSSKVMMEQVNKTLPNAKNSVESTYEITWNSDVEAFKTEFMKESNKVSEIKLVNNVIAKNIPAMVEGNRVNTLIYKYLEPQTSDEFNLATIINAYDGMNSEYASLDKEFTQWKTNCTDLNNKIAEAKAYEAQPEHQDAIKEMLTPAITKAEGIYHDCANKFAADIKCALDELDKVIADADDYDQNWYITDTKSEFKAGKYDANHVKYTRTGNAIDINNYGTFCLPMDITVTYDVENNAQFSNVYLPTEFAILNTETKKLKIFLTKVEEATVIPAGTPFFAQLACKEELNLISNNSLKVENGKVFKGEDEVNVTTKTIQVYNQSANSSFVSLNNEISCTWGGTFKKIAEDLTDKLLFNRYGAFGPASGYIDPFRAYIELKEQVNAKSIEAIEVEFGDGSETTGINSIMVGSSDGSQIFSIDGKKMGTDMNSLNKGVYIINGKKVLK